MYRGLPDAELVRMLQAGHDEAAAAIWERYSPMVRRIVRRTIAAGSETEDLVQEVFLRFIDQVGKLRSPESLKAFLYGIASRYSISELRRRRVRRLIRLSDTGAVPDVPVATDDHEARAALHALERALDALPARERVVFVLHDVEGLEFSEVATAMRLSESTVKRAAASARLRLVRLAEGEPALHGYLRQPEPRVRGGSV